MFLKGMTRFILASLYMFSVGMSFIFLVLLCKEVPATGSWCAMYTAYLLLVLLSALSGLIFYKIIKRTKRRDVELNLNGRKI